MSKRDDMRNAVEHSLLILKNKPGPTIADLRTAAQLVIALMGGMNKEIDLEELVRQIERVVNVHAAKTNVLDN